MHANFYNKPLYDFALSVVLEANYKIITATDNLYAQADVAIDLLIKTTYEKKFLAQGFNICYLSFVV